MIRAVLALMIAACLAGCATAGKQPPAPSPQGQCDTAKVQRLLGRDATAALIETIRRESGSAIVRTIAPGSMVTMDYRPDRVSVSVDAGNRIIAIRCG